MCSERRKIGQGKEDNKKPTSRNNDVLGRPNLLETIDAVISTYLCENKSEGED